MMFFSKILFQAESTSLSAQQVLHNNNNKETFL